MLCAACSRENLPFSVAIRIKNIHPQIELMNAEITNFREFRVFRVLF